MYLVGEFKPGKSILWHAGASAVSIAGIQLSKADNASAIYATTRSDEKNKFCVETLGATAAFNSETSPDWSEELQKASGGKGADVIIDFMGGKTPRAPRWVRAVGMEWLYRLGREPRRLFRRYVIGNPLFVARALRLAAGSPRPGQSLDSAG